jgi:phosphatidylglycerol:prolipoprotein diacylglycerol transferase
MRPTLINIAPVSPLACLAIFAFIVVGIGLWLLLQRYRHTCTRDQWLTAAAIAGMAALFLLVIVRVGQFRVNSYGTMLMLGFIAGTYTAVRLGRRRHVPQERILDLGLLILIGSVVGARVVYVLITPNAGPLIDINQVMKQGLGGLSFHGGLIGGVLAATIYVRATKLDFWRMADSLAPGLAVGYAITRIGCFLNGCCYGKVTHLPWAMNFLHSPDGPVYSRHPTQLYASLMGFAMYGILLLLARGKSLGRAGRLLMTFLMLEGVERFVMEIYRQPDPNFHSGLTAAQQFSVVIAIVGICGWFLLRKRPAVVEE